MQYNTLEEAFSSAADGDTVIMVADSTGNNSIILDKGYSLTLDLNGNNISFTENQNFKLVDVNLHVTGQGKVSEESPYYGPFLTDIPADTVPDAETVHLTIGPEVTVEGWVPVFIDQNGYNTVYGVVVDIQGTLNSVRDVNGSVGSGIYVNGQITNEGGNVPEINIHGGATITSPGLGLYLAGFAHTSILRGEITGGTGIELRAGTLDVRGGTITGTATPVVSNPNGDGSTTSGAGIALVQHTTGLESSVHVYGGTVKGSTALYQNNAQSNDPDVVAKVDIMVSGGDLIRTHDGDGATAVYSENKTDFIIGGNFLVQTDPSDDPVKESSDLSDYLYSGYTVGDDGGVSYTDVDNAVVQLSDGNKYPVLEHAILNASDNDTVTLLDNTSTTQLLIDKPITLDLNGKTLTITDNGSDSNGLVFTTGANSIIGDGIIKDTQRTTSSNSSRVFSTVVASGDGTTLIVSNTEILFENPASNSINTNGMQVLNGATLTLNSGVSIKSETTIMNTVGVRVFAETAGVTSLYVNDGVEILVGGYGVSGNGSAAEGTTYIEVNGGTITGEVADGIYHPQIGELKITDGEIRGQTGVEMRSGTLTVTGGTIIGTATEFSAPSNPDGNVATGAGISIIQHTTENPITVAIGGDDTSI